MSERTGRARKSSPRVECLEGRQLLTGNVTASIVGDDLVINGDNSGNWIQVSQVEEKRFTIKGISTTINGRTSQTFTVPDGIQMSMKGGADTVDVRGGGSSSFLKVFGDLDIDAGTGDDSIIVKNVLVTDDIRIETGKGRDWVRVQSSRADDDISVEKSAENPGDFDVVNIYDVETDRNRNGGGKLTVNLSNGPDKVHVYFVYSEEMQIRLRGGEDSLNLAFTRRDASIANTFDMGSGRDTVNLYQNYKTSAGNVNFDPPIKNHEVITRKNSPPSIL